MNEKPVVLIVDDTVENLRLLSELLGNAAYEVRIANSGKKALESIAKSLPQLILLDIMMPEMDGYEVCRRLKAEPRTASIPVIFISALGMGEQKVNAFKEGAVDYITKPFYADEVIARVDTNVQNYLYRNHLEELVATRTHQLLLANEATIASMAILAEHRDNETGVHIQRTKMFVRALAEEIARNGAYAISQEDIELLQQSAPLHDIGKVGIRDSVLFKTDRLTAEEYEEIKKHSLIGAEVINKAIAVMGNSSYLHFALELTEAHHERWDGSGYPHGLKAEEIPLSARLMAVADVYDALRSKRPYKDAIPHEKAVRIILDGDGRTSPEHFDPVVLDAFASVEAEFASIWERMA